MADLPQWTPDRERKRDYRILFMDSFKPHLSAHVQALCAKRGYIVLYHYGGTTGIAQVNDTHLHFPLSKFYQELEMHSFERKQMEDPMDISRTPTECAADVFACWRMIDHAQVGRGHWHVGLANALDGSEDHLMKPSITKLWNELGLSMGYPPIL